MVDHKDFHNKIKAFSMSVFDAVVDYLIAKEMPSASGMYIENFKQGYKMARHYHLEQLSFLLAALPDVDIASVIEDFVFKNVRSKTGRGAKAFREGYIRCFYSYQSDMAEYLPFILSSTPVGQEILASYRAFATADLPASTICPHCKSVNRYSLSSFQLGGRPVTLQCESCGEVVIVLSPLSYEN